MTPLTIYSRFKEQARKRPDAPAVVEDGRAFSYARLDAMANDIVARFYSRHMPFIGIVMTHGAEMIAAMLAVLKSGAAYVPAEPSLPADRRDYMMRSAGVELVITDSFCRDLPPAPEDFPDLSTPSSPAYILYTSGTTGRPKGVIVENHSVVNYAQAFREEMDLTAADVMLQLSVCTFDIFVEEVFTTLLNGASLAIPRAATVKGPIEGLMDFVERHAVSEISGFPYLLADMNKLPALPPSLRLLISGGDVLRASFIDRLKDMGPMIYNTYGPSETTVCSNYFRCDNAEPLEDGTYPIGHSIHGVEVAVMDDDLHEVPDGITGEICIMGEGVSRGYLGNPPEQKNFVTLADGRRLYRSGDLGYRLPSGSLAFLHRKDSQVMILGKRVEPEEVENVLNESPDVAQGVVRPYLDEAGLAYLVAFVVGKGRNFSLHRIKDWLRSKLTDFMVPEFFVSLNRLPLNSHGKVDNDSLPRVMKEGGLK